MVARMETRSAARPLMEVTAPRKDVESRSDDPHQECGWEFETMLRTLISRLPAKICSRNRFGVPIYSMTSQAKNVKRLAIGPGPHDCYNRHFPRGNHGACSVTWALECHVGIGMC